MIKQFFGLLLMFVVIKAVLFSIFFPFLALLFGFWGLLYFVGGAKLDGLGPFTRFLMLLFCSAWEYFWWGCMMKLWFTPEVG